mmetsp:Transcript_145493/g.464955  ORF Transcript_145493/g.464955 Transcript_145493/m.464955 type:complete len:185 (+) Transcript_145493:2277-2831(+)
MPRRRRPRRRCWRHCCHPPSARPRPPLVAAAVAAAAARSRTPPRRGQDEGGVACGGAAGGPPAREGPGGGASSGSGGSLGSGGGRGDRDGLGAVLPSHKATRSVNDEGAPVAPGRDRTCSHLFYCGRNLGEAAIPGSDGRCGPSNGPQCSSCKRYQAGHRPWRAGTEPVMSSRPAVNYEDDFED